MKITATMLYFLNEEDAQRFDAENRDDDDAYFQGMLPETTTHSVNQSDLEGDDHAWLADMGYDHEEGFEITFSEQDGNELRTAILSGLLEHGYTVCAWSDKLLIQPGTLRVQHMVEMDLLHAALNVSDETTMCSVQAALDFVEDTRHMFPALGTEDTTAFTQADKEAEAHIVKSRKRHFYRTEVKITILTEGPYDPISLDQVSSDAMYGECSMVFTVEKSEQIDGPTMARLCLEQFSDPALFDLTDEGEDLDDARENQDEQSLPQEYRLGRGPKPETKAT